MAYSRGELAYAGAVEMEGGGVALVACVSPRPGVRFADPPALAGQHQIVVRDEVGVPRDVRDAHLRVGGAVVAHNDL